MNKKLLISLKRAIFFLLLFSLTFSLSACQIDDIVDIAIDGILSITDELPENNAETTEDKNTDVPVIVDGKIRIHFLDVGQGDSILITSNEGVILVDASLKNSSVTKSICEYIQNLGINEIDYFVLTHPHADHIGGAPTIINTFEIKNVIMPDCAATTKIFEETLDAIEAKNINVLEAVSGDEYSVGSVNFKILAPNSASYSETNDYSVVFRLSYGEASAMFTGDAEKLSEDEILSKYSARELKSDLLKVGHHGSSSSSSVDFLKAVSPKYAVMSLGKDNSYGHPHDEIIKRFENMEITYYRTDIEGTVVFSCDGKTFIKE